MNALQPDWTLVQVEGRFTGFLDTWSGEAVAYGGRSMTPVALLLNASGVKTETFPEGSGPITSACSYSAFDFVVGRVRPWLVTHDFDLSSHLPNCQCNSRLEDATTLDAVRLWTVCPMDNNGVVVTIREDGWVVPGHSVDGSYPTGPGLRVTGSVEEVDLVVRAWGEYELAVAGPLVDGNGRTSPLWRYGVTDSWEPFELVEQLDAVTDLVDGCWVAGHRDLRPVLTTTAETGPTTHELPVDLDPDHPQVLVIERQDLVALQSVDGPQLWAHVDGTWTGSPLPPGRLDAAIHVQPVGPSDYWEDVETDNRIFVALDGQIWHTPYPIG